MYRYNTGTSAWEELSNCVLGSSTITCETTDFSTFGLFGLVAAGGGAPQNHPTSVCSKDTKQCVEIFPKQGNSVGTSYADYRTCIQSASTKTPEDCTKEWAITNLYQTCNSDNECPIPTAQAALDIVQEALEGRTTEAEPTANVCQTEQLVRYAERRGRGLPAGVYETDTNNPAYDYAVDLAEQDIIHGDNEDGQLRINDLVARAEAVKTFSRAAEHLVQVHGGCLDNDFSDVETNSWYHRYVQNLKDQDIVHGYDDGLYRPARNINQAELYKIAAITFGYTTKQAQQLDQKEWHEHYRASLNLAGVIPSLLSEYTPEAQVTRG